MAFLALIASLVLACCGFALADYIIPLSDADKQVASDAHNKYRADAGALAMQKLKWNDALAQFAQNTAYQCDFKHTSYEARQNVGGFSYIGENIYTVSGAADQPTLQKAIDDWASEEKFYDLNTNSCSDMCGHYTQIVWASTTDVGCAIAECDQVKSFTNDKGYIIFCNYGTGGNIIGEKPYEKASSSWEIGSKCQEKFNEATDSSGLCVPSGDGGQAPVTTTTAAPAPAGCTEADTSDPENCLYQWDCNYICAEDDWSVAAFNGWANCNWDCGWKCK